MDESVRLRVDQRSVAVVELDIPRKKVNVLSSAAMERLAEVVGELRALAGIRGVVVASGKPGGFVAGADIEEISAIGTASEGTQKAARGQAIFTSLAELEVPVVAAIDGACLGGGAELALACDYRIASDDSSTRIGLPEVNLGILPGFGGTQRLPRLIGVGAALHLILSGRTVGAEPALRIGLVDGVVSRQNLLDEAIQWAASRPKRNRGRAIRLEWKSRLLEGNPWGHRFLFRQAHRRVAARTQGFYPAPLKALEAVRRGIALPLSEGLALEARLLGELVVSDACRNLVWLYRAGNAAKSGGPGAGASSRLESGVAGPDLKQRRAVERLGVIGAGVMGSGIAQVASDRGLAVTLKDIDEDAVRRGSESIRRIYDRAVQKGKSSPAEAYSRALLVTTTTDSRDLANADVAIEAAVEDMAVKQSILREFEEVSTRDAIFATNTSSLSVTELASAANHPDRVVGMHFFNPVYRMPLVEVIAGNRTAPETIEAIVALSGRLGKVPIVVKDSPGFLVNRVLGPYLNEACLLLEEGSSIAEIDGALTGFGMPMGPFRLLDEIGLDVAHKVQVILRQAYAPEARVSTVLDVLAATDRRGRKSGRGFYVHDSRRARVDASVEALFSRRAPATKAASAEEIRDRAIFAMLNEAAVVVGLGVVRSSDDVDLAMVLGTGFPAFRGGLFRHAERLGFGRVVARLQELAIEHGARFAPAELLLEKAAHQGGSARVA